MSYNHKSKMQEGSSPFRGVWTFAVLAFLLVYTTWVWAGIRPSFHRVGVGAAGLLLMVCALEGRGSVWRVWVRDAAFWLGLAFLGFLGIQWANSGREQYFNMTQWAWVYSDPPWPRWPSAFARADAAQMLSWFFPAWVVVAVIRSKLLSRDMLYWLLFLLVSSAAFLSVFGLVQFASGTRMVYWMEPLKGHFFASFGYGNHAGPFFVLVESIGLGLMFREIFDLRKTYSDTPSATKVLNPWRVGWLILASLMCSVGAMMGFSRTGILLNGALVLFGAIYLFVRAWPLYKAAGRMNMVMMILGVLGCLFFLATGFGAKGLEREFAIRELPAGVSETLLERVDFELGYRPRFAWAAVKIWWEKPWFGVGGWGYKYLVLGHFPVEYWHVVERRGWANVHVDWLQFLTEFGVVGFGLMFASCGVIWCQVRTVKRGRHDAFFMFASMGILLTLIASCLDIPFRAPAILYTWLVLLASMPVVGNIRSPDAAPAVSSRKNSL